MDETTIPSTGGKEFTVERDGDFVSLSWEDPGFPGGDAIFTKEAAAAFGTELFTAALDEEGLNRLAAAREVAFEAVRTYINSTDRVPEDTVTRNAMIWSGVHAALDALTVVTAAPLTGADRRFLTFALDQAAQEKTLGEGLSEEDMESLARLRLLAGEDQA